MTREPLAPIPADRTLEGLRPWIIQHVAGGFREHEIAEILDLEPHRMAYAITALGLRKDAR